MIVSLWQEDVWRRHLQSGSEAELVDGIIRDVLKPFLGQESKKGGRISTFLGIQYTSYSRKKA